VRLLSEFGLQGTVEPAWPDREPKSPFSMLCCIPSGMAVPIWYPDA